MEHEPFRVPMTLSPHYVNGKARGFYLLAQRIWPGGAPILNKKQFIGFNGQCLLVTVEHNGLWKTPLQIFMRAGALQEKGMMWMCAAPLYPMSKGFRMYVPGNILLPRSEGNIVTFGVFQYDVPTKIYFLEIPEITGNVLLGRIEIERKEV